MAKTYQLGLLGWPVDHSLSPTIHHYWMKQYHIVGYYRLLSVQPKDFSTWMREFKEKKFDGFNVTYPYKSKALRYIDKIDHDAKIIGAVNTVFIDQHGQVKGWNTDGEGFAQTLPFRVRGKKIMILGAGATARAIALALSKRQIEEVKIVCRAPDKIKAFCQYLSCPVDVIPWQQRHESLKDVDLLIQATSVGMAKGKGESPLDDLSLLPKTAIVADAIYHPLLTPLLHQALNLDLKIHVGLSLLVGQARLSFQHWFGIRPRANRELLEKILCYQPEDEVKT